MSSSSSLPNAQDNRDSTSTKQKSSADRNTIDERSTSAADAKASGNNSRLIASFGIEPAAAALLDSTADSQKHSGSSGKEYARRRLEEKREYNRQVSAKARLRTKQQLSDLVQQVDDLKTKVETLENQNLELVSQLNDMRKENELLYQLLSQGRQQEPAAENNLSTTLPPLESAVTAAATFSPQPSPTTDDRAGVIPGMNPILFSDVASQVLKQTSLVVPGALKPPLPPTPPTAARHEFALPPPQPSTAENDPMMAIRALLLQDPQVAYQLLSWQGATPVNAYDPPTDFAMAPPPPPPPPSTTVAAAVPVAQVAALAPFLNSNNQVPPFELAGQPLHALASLLSSTRQGITPPAAVEANAFLTNVFSSVAAAPVVASNHSAASLLPGAVSSTLLPELVLALTTPSPSTSSNKRTESQKTKDETDRAK